MTTTYCGARRVIGHGDTAICGQPGPLGIHQCDRCALQDLQAKLKTEHAQMVERAPLSIARVAHEVCAALAVSGGDYSTKPWEALPQGDQDRLQARVMGFLNNPEMHPTADLGPAVATLSASARASAYVFHGVVHAIAREQARD